MTALIVGASSGLGRVLVQTLAEKGYSLLLIASESRDLDAIAADLRLRFNSAVTYLALDFSVESDPGRKIQIVLQDLPPLRILLLPLGYSCFDDDFSSNTKQIDLLLKINLSAPLVIIQSLLPQLLANQGIVVGFGSIAAVRGRGRNVVYAAAKRGLQSYFESLHHRYEESELKSHFYQLGFMQSNLTFGLSLPPLPVTSPEKVAREVIRRLGCKSGTFYLPTWWGLIALVIKILPLKLFRKLKS